MHILILVIWKADDVMTIFSLKIFSEFVVTTIPYFPVPQPWRCIPWFN